MEHLKVPLERNNTLWSELNAATQSSDLLTDYKRNGALRDGRELVLPANIKALTVHETAQAVRKSGMTFGAADNEFQYMSDFECCCSGVDQFPGFERVFKYQIALAVKRSLGRQITPEVIKDEWKPVGVIDRYLNSRSRIGGTIDDYIRHRWNDVAAVGSPASFAGVAPTGKFQNGFRIYEWTSSLGST